MVPSLIVTSSRGLKTPSSYFALMVMLVANQVPVPIYWVLRFMVTLSTDRSLRTVFPDNFSCLVTQNADAGYVATPNHSPSEVEDAETAVERVPPMPLALARINGRVRHSMAPIAFP